MLQRFVRLLKHRWFDLRHSRHAMSADMFQRLMQRVHVSEQRHSGEIRICVETGLPNSYLLRNASMRQLTRQRAVMLFSKLRLWDTAHNNGVLVYLLLAERAIELVADRGLQPHVSNAEWKTMVDRMSAAFQQGRFEDGLTQALEEVSAVLVQHFPLAPGEVHRNELPDTPHLN